MSEQVEQSPSVEKATHQPEGRITPSNPPVGALLTEKQRAFCIEMHKGATVSEAYARSFPGERSRKESGNRGRKLARLPHIAEFLLALKEKTLDYLDVSPAQITRETARIGFSDIRKLFGPDGEILPIEQWSDDAAAAVSGYEEEVSANGTRLKRKIKLWDKPGALKMLADFKAMTNAKPDATQRATFTFNFGTGKGATRGRMGGRTIEAEPVPARALAKAPA